MDPSEGVLLGGKYQLERPLASGGMGSIWVARHVELDTPIAVKLIGWAKALEPVLVERFRREARAAAQLRSPHIIQIMDYGVERGVPFMVMELLDGEDLAAHLERMGPLSITRSLEIARPICKALTIVHTANLIHRDIKPANVFLARMGDEEVVKLVDFGIVRSEDPGLKLTDQLSIVGSPAYMSPEQILNRSVDRRTDLWSLGLVLFEMIVGCPAVDGASLAELHEAILKLPIPRASELRSGLGPLDAFFEKALARDANERFSSAKELLTALEAGVAKVDDKNLKLTAPASSSRRKRATATTAAVLDPTRPSAPDGRQVAIRVEAKTQPSDIGSHAVTPKSHHRTADLVRTLEPSSDSVPPAKKRTTFVLVGAGVVACAAVLGVVIMRKDDPREEATPAASAPRDERSTQPASAGGATAVISVTPEANAVPSVTFEPPPSASASASAPVSSSAPPVASTAPKPLVPGIGPLKPPPVKGPPPVPPVTPPSVTNDPIWGVPVTKPKP